MVGSFPERLREVMRINDMSASELARLLCVPCSTISRYERGTSAPSLRNLLSLCDVLDVSADWMLGRRVAADSPRIRVPSVRRWIVRQPDDPTGRPTPIPQADRQPHRHSYGCTHVLNLLNRDAPDCDPLALQAAELLNQGKTETEALAALGLMKDDLEEIA